MLTISGVSAEEIDGFSSVVAESPVSAELDNSLSSYDASYDELSDYENYASECEGFRHGDESLLASDSGFYESLDSFDSDEDLSCEIIDSSEVCESNISCGYVNSSDCCDLQVPCDSDNLDGFKTVDMSDSIIYESNEYQYDVYCVGEITPALGVVDNNVIVNDCDYYLNDNDVIRSTNSLDKSCISDFKSLTRYDELRSNNPNSEISRVTVDMEASISDNLGIANSQFIDFLKSIGDYSILDKLKHYLQEISGASEPAFDNVLVTSGYISDGEVYFGTISESDREMLLKYVGAENVILFASSAMDCNIDVILRILNNVTLNQQTGEINIAGCKSSKGLLKYSPSTNEVYISLSEGDDEDEHGHVINDTNSHGLDYAYVKHVNVIYKDMPNLIVLSSSGDVEQSTEGSWDSLNDVLGASMSSETLLPDHKAIWTPLLLLLQQDLQESIVKSHADDNWNETINEATGDADDGADWSNITPKGWIHDYEKWLREHGGYNNYNGYDYYDYAPCHEEDYGGYEPDFNGSKPKDALTNGTGNVTGSSKNKHDNSTDDKNESSNATSTVNKGKSVGNTNAVKPASAPTYTLVYAIIGIAIVSLLFNSGYMKRDD